MDRDCQSGLCADGRCGEAKFCASRFLYDALGVNIQLRTYDGFAATLHHTPDPIKCGQCVCEDCPVIVQPWPLLASANLPTPGAVCQPPGPAVLLANAHSAHQCTPPCRAGHHLLFHGHRG